MYIMHNIFEEKSTICVQQMRLVSKTSSSFLSMAAHDLSQRGACVTCISLTETSLSNR